MQESADLSLPDEIWNIERYHNAELGRKSSVKQKSEYVYFIY